MVSLFLCLHLLAVFAPPFTFMTSPVRGMGSPLAEGLMQGLGWYIDAAYLNHGYAFFAPDPGPSHLLRIKLYYADKPTEILTFPDLEEHWPRLLYHRHFMLSEHLHSAFVPPTLPAELLSEEMPPQIREMERQRHRQARDIYEARLRALEEHLKARYGADRVEIERVEHRLLGPFEFANERTPLDAADTYLVLPDTGLPEERP